VSFTPAPVLFCSATLDFFTDEALTTSYTMPQWNSANGYASPTLPSLARPLLNIHLDAGDPRYQGNAEASTSSSAELPNVPAYSASESDELVTQPNSPATPRAKKVPGSPAKKEFICTGYGECAMAFSRQEHLARHVRLVAFFLFSVWIWSDPALQEAYGRETLQVSLWQSILQVR
jgi:hypothetical protein